MANTIERGVPFETTNKVAIMIHGRGSSATQIVTLADHLHLDQFTLLAPQAPGNSWYPYSFLAPRDKNQPALDSALEQVKSIVTRCLKSGLTTEQLYFIGFSQGACLALEFTARNPARYGGIVAFTGGVIGESLEPTDYSGQLEDTPVFIGSSEQDMHVPLHRIKGSEEILKDMGANVKTLIFPDTYHTIREEEIEWVNRNILSY
nr:phospholipase [Cytophagales bacterium]